MVTKRVWAVALTLLASNVAFALLYAEMPLEQKVARSERVVIARAISFKSATPDDPFGVTLVRVESTLKGAPKETLEVMTTGGIAESDPLCCEIGRTYLMFLAPAKRGRYVSVNGPYGVYLINPDDSKEATLSP